MTASFAITLAAAILAVALLVAREVSGQARRVTGVMAMLTVALFGASVTWRFVGLS